MNGVDDNKLEPSDEYKFKCSICMNNQSLMCHVCKNQDRFVNAFNRKDSDVIVGIVEKYSDYNQKIVEGGKKILEFFGNNAQHMKTFEEMGELQSELARANREGIKNELADVQVMLLQMQMIYQIDHREIIETMIAKISRTLAKIDSLKSGVDRNGCR